MLVNKKLILGEIKMGNEIRIFENVKFGKVRTLARDDEPWFVGEDIAHILGYDNIKVALFYYVKEKNKSTFAELEDSGKRHKLVIVNEDGVNNLICGRHWPRCCEFRQWLVNEVIPAMLDYHQTLNNEEEATTSMESVIKLITELKEEYEKKKQAEKIIKEHELKIDDLISELSELVK